MPNIWLGLAAMTLSSLTNPPAEQCPHNATMQLTTCPAGWSCAAKNAGQGACHFEYPPSVPPHRENCFGCTKGNSKTVCEPNLPTVAMSAVLPNVLIVGDSISHGYFPVLRDALHGTVAQLQHAPSNTGALEAGVACFNITTLLGSLGELPTPWDLVVFNFGLHDTAEPTPPPLPRALAGAGHSVANYMAGLRRYTDLVLHSARAKRALWASTTPFMAGGMPAVQHLQQMNGNASTLMASLGVPEVDLWGPIVDYCAPGGLPFASCNISSGCPVPVAACSVPAMSTPHFNTAGYDLLVGALVPAIKSALKSTPTMGA